MYMRGWGYTKETLFYCVLIFLSDRVQLNLTDRLQSNQIWSIPNIYQSKEILTLASEAKRSILIQCKQGKTYMQHFLAVCEGWGAVSRIVIINRSVSIGTCRCVHTQNPVVGLVFWQT